MDASLGVKDAMTDSQCTNATQMQIQTCALVLGDVVNGLVLFVVLQRKGRSDA